MQIAEYLTEKGIDFIIKSTKNGIEISFMYLDCEMNIPIAANTSIDEFEENINLKFKKTFRRSERISFGYD
jgi:hypothetical protein